ncbi:MAG: TVP38/TMEM64 family protein [Reyranella sp.]|uniref:TVP38/TMEM64 family protein n=1 Tax=Reyranella sp. TaxID=1929291 RepID=UPI001219F835|nr:TVP38/TMEM64 family protein [Reyranella sp.]TAJ86368.1 MAG: TVP38/TMEM64 family protein [Reyranella sp.]
MNTSTLRRLLPVAILLAGLATFLLLGLDRYFSFEMLARHKATVTAWVAAHRLPAALAFLLAYAIMVAFSLPVAMVATPVGGFLFGTWAGAGLSVIGATLGSIAVFLAARYAFRDLFRARAGTKLARLEDGFRHDDFSYLLFLRLVPVFPFWLINIVPALLGMPIRRYVLATMLGIVPASIIYSGLGAGLGAMLKRGEQPNLGIIFEWHILLPLLGLAVLALLPVVFARWRRRRSA